MITGSAAIAKVCAERIGRGRPEQEFGALVGIAEQRGDAVRRGPERRDAPRRLQHQHRDRRLEQERRADHAQADRAAIVRQRERDQQDDGDTGQADQDTIHVPATAPRSANWRATIHAKSPPARPGLTRARNPASVACPWKHPLPHDRRARSSSFRSSMAAWSASPACWASNRSRSGRSRSRRGFSGSCCSSCCRARSPNCMGRRPRPCWSGSASCRCSPRLR